MLLTRKHKFQHWRQRHNNAGPHSMYICVCMFVDVPSYGDMYVFRTKLEWGEIASNATSWSLLLFRNGCASGCCNDAWLTDLSRHWVNEFLNLSFKLSAVFCNNQRLRERALHRRLLGRLLIVSRQWLWHWVMHEAVNKIKESEKLKSWFTAQFADVQTLNRRRKRL